MKRIFWKSYRGIVLVALIWAQPFAQQVQNNTFSFGESASIGVKGGLYFSYFRGAGVELLEEQLEESFTTFWADPQVYFSGGVFATLTLNEFFGVQPELIFHRSGKRYHASLDDEDYNFGVRIDYLSIPILFRTMAPTPGMMFRPHFFFGPVVNVVLNARAEGINTVPTDVELGFLDEFRANDDIRDLVRPYDIGLILGVGVDAKAGPGYIGFELRYVYGGTDLFDRERVAEEIRNAGIGIYVGYAVDI